METLYKVLIVLCLLFVAGGIIYMMYFAPKASAAIALALLAIQ